jgi:hypothetical protein
MDDYTIHETVQLKHIILDKMLEHFSLITDLGTVVDSKHDGILYFNTIMFATTVPRWI